MFTDFLWFMGAKHQHDKQMEQGLAGLIGILAALFMVWKWDSLFFPILNRIGLVDMTHRIGLIGEMPILTVLNVLSLIFVFCVFLGLTAIVLLILGLFLSSTKAGNIILGTAALLFFSPFILFFEINKLIHRFISPIGNGSLNDTYKRDKELRPLLNKYKTEPESMKMFKLFEEQINRTDEGSSVSKISTSKLKTVLNRTVASIEHDKDWQFGYDKWEDQWYILFYNPLPEFASPCAHKKFSSKKSDLFSFPTQDIKGFFVSCGDRESEGFFVPSLKIDFIWQDEEIKPVVAEQTYYIDVKNTKHLHSYTVEGKAIDEFFKQVSSERKDVLDAIHYAHMVFYLIPIAFRGDNSYSAEKRYNKAMRAIPGVNKYYPKYANDVKEQINWYIEFGHQWAIDWNSEVETNKRRLLCEEKIY